MTAKVRLRFVSVMTKKILFIYTYIRCRNCIQFPYYHHSVLMRREGRWERRCSFPFSHVYSVYHIFEGYTCKQSSPIFTHYTHYHHYADLSEGIGHRKCLSGIFCRVCAWDQFGYLNYHSYNVWSCAYFQLSNFFVMIVRICVFYLLLITNLEVWFINHHLGYGHKTMVCCMSCYVLIRNKNE